MTRGAPPIGFNVDRYRYPLGRGERVYEQSVAALRLWAMFRQSWIRIETVGRFADVGAVIAIIVRVGPIWWTNACRVVYVVNEQSAFRRTGFAYGTLPGHAECGEELFSVEMDDRGDVWYDLSAYSRPRHWLARLGYPLTRSMQRRFATDSAAAMMTAISE